MRVPGLVGAETRKSELAAEEIRKQAQMVAQVEIRLAQRFGAG
jgi:hypothetical protein